MAKIKNIHLLVIGGTGFIGKHLVYAAKKKGWKVSSISLHLPKINQKIKGVNYKSLDIRNKKTIKKISNIHFDYVVNLSGYIDHTLFKDGGYKQIDSHFNGLLNLIYFISRKKLKKFIQIGSSDEYGKSTAPQKENLRELPISPYSLAKVSSTHFLQMLYRTEKFPVIIIRLFLTYGPGQNDKRLIPQVIKGSYSNNKFNTSNGIQIRDFCYIKDVIDAMFLLLKSKKTNGEIFNIGSGIPIKVKSVINQICKMIGKGKPQFGKIILKENENTILYANINKIKKTIGWKPNISLHEGLKETINSFNDK